MHGIIDKQLFGSSILVRIRDSFDQLSNVPPPEERLSNSELLELDLFFVFLSDYYYYLLSYVHRVAIRCLEHLYSLWSWNSS